MKSVSFIGSGNVATHLAKSFYNKGIRIHQIWSMQLLHAQELANVVDAQPLDQMAKLDFNEVDLILISVKDDVLPELAKRISDTETPIAHTSGSVDMEVLSHLKNYGVFYPLQTFSKNKELDMNKTPLCLESSSPEVLEKMMLLGKEISSDVRSISSAQRKEIHVAAVFACNFTNHMLAIADEILNKSNQDISILAPLVEETIKKGLEETPKNVQTGPAQREDRDIIEKHLEKLTENPDYKEIYRQISESIIRMKNA